jgi:hypothetical protein
LAQNTPFYPGKGLPGHVFRGFVGSGRVSPGLCALGGTDVPAPQIPTGIEIKHVFSQISANFYCECSNSCITQFSIMVRSTDCSFPQTASFCVGTSKPEQHIKCDFFNDYVLTNNVYIDRFFICCIFNCNSFTSRASPTTPPGGQYSESDKILLGMDLGTGLPSAIGGIVTVWESLKNNRDG